MTKNKKIVDNTKFKANVNYQIGVVPENTEKFDFTSEPVFSPRPNKSISQVGAFFMSPPISCKTFWEYLSKNPHQFPLHKSVACYAYNANTQMWEFVGKGNPSATGEKANLSDGTLLTEQNRVPQGNDNYRTDKIIAQTLQDNLSNYQRQNDGLQAQIDDLRDKWFAQMEENKKLQADNERLTIQNETFKGQIDAWMKKDEGMADAKPSLMDNLGSIISHPSVAPVLAEGLGMLINAAKQKFGGSPPPQPPTEAEQKFQNYQNGTAPVDSLSSTGM